MKLKFLAIPLITSCMTLTSLAGMIQSIAQPTTAEAMEGGGFSTDSQQPTTNACFNVRRTSETGQTGRVRLDSNASFSDLQNEFQVSLDVVGEIGQFKMDAESNYFRSLQDTSYSLSVNYFQHAYNTVTLGTIGAGRSALTETGLSFYDNAFPYFGLSCGDNYINSFRQGAQFITALNLRFASSFEKERFKAAAGVSYGNIVSASSTIEYISNREKINGTIIIQAYQLGGDPSQLARILNRNNEGYYALQCSLQNMRACVNATNDLLRYAVENFPTQFSFVPPARGLVPLSMAFSTYQPIYYLGLTSPPSLVTPDVVQNRLLLGRTILENEYYQKNLDQLLNGYIVPLDVGSNLYRNSQTLLNNAKGNIAILRSLGNPLQGALGCYNFPVECARITQNIQTQLRPILPAQLTYLNSIQSVVNFTSPGWGIWYGSGDNFARTALASPFRNGTMEVTPTVIRGVTLFEPNGNRWTGDLTSTGGGNYAGLLCRNGPCQNVTVTTTRNPFYFDFYQAKKNSEAV